MPDLEAPTRFPPVGRCIYCGVLGTETALTDEHILPFGLGGNVVLPQASCKKCAHITGAIVEQYCLKRMLGAVRTQRGFQTRHPKERPKKYRLTLDMGTHQEVREEEFCLRPRIFSMPAFPYPSILYDLPEPKSEQKITGKLFTISVKEDFQAAASRHPNAKRITVHGEFNMLMLARMLAKIGHAFGVAEYGYGSFPLLLPPLILGNHGNMIFNHFIGGSLDIFPNSPNTHDLRLERITTPLTNTEYLVASIRLFADLGGPLYYVVVGPSAGLGEPLRARKERL